MFISPRRLIIKNLAGSFARPEIRTKATLQGFNVASGLVVVLLHALSGLTTIPVLWYFLVSMPPLVLGTYLGSFFYGRIDERAYKRIMFLIITFLGASLIYGVL